MTTKPTTIRIETDILNQIEQKCNSLKCNRNDYIKNAIEFVLTGSSDFNFDDELDLEPTSQKIESRHEMKNVRISYDGKTWIDLPQK